jgi:hypothetical protein
MLRASVAGSPDRYHSGESLRKTWLRVTVEVVYTLRGDSRSLERRDGMGPASDGRTHFKGRSLQATCDNGRRRECTNTNSGRTRLKVQSLSRVYSVYEHEPQERA